MLGAGYQELKIIDFSLARTVENDNGLDTLPNNIKYMGTHIDISMICIIYNIVAPEVIQLHPLSTSCDMWSLGAIAIFM